jgi:mRNA interferase RelE/StbE
LTHRVRLSAHAVAYLKALDSRTRGILCRRIEELKTDPEKRGKALTAELSGYRSLHAAGRYRIVFQVRKAEVLVLVIAIAIGLRREGDRADVYELLRRLVKMGLLEG